MKLIKRKTEQNTLNRKNIKALKACYAEIEHTHPDLVVVTGDLSFPLGIMSMSLNNTAPVGSLQRLCEIPAFRGHSPTATTTRNLLHLQTSRS